MRARAAAPRSRSGCPSRRTPRSAGEARPGAFGGGDTGTPGPHPVPDDVRAFVVDFIDSVPALEALLLMCRQRQREWTAADVAADLFVDVRRVVPILADLATRGLCGSRRPEEPGRKAEEPVYFWRPATPAIEQALEKLAAAYRTHLVAVTNLIHDKPRASVRGFSDAFRIRGTE